MCISLSAVGLISTALLLWSGDWLLQNVIQDVDVSRDILPYVIIGIQGLVVGCLLSLMVVYYPSLEGFFSSLVVVFWLLVRDEFTLGMDNFIELLLKFEIHFACLYISALVLFLAKGGGLYYPLFIGIHYLRFKMITAFSVAGVAFGVAAMVVVLSVMSGFEMDIKDKIVGTNAHAILQKRGADFSDYEIQINKIKTVPGVVAATPFVYNEVMVSSEFNISGVFIKGIDIDTAGQVTDLEKTIEEGSLELLTHPEKIHDFLKKRREEIIRRSIQAPAADSIETQPNHSALAETKEEAQADATNDLPDSMVVAVSEDTDPESVPQPEPLTAKPGGVKNTPGIFIGRELKKILRVELGEQINIVSPHSGELGPTGMVPRARAFVVVGVFYTGMYEYDAKSVYVALDEAQEFFDMGESVTGIGLKFEDMDRAGPICEELIAVLDGYPFFTRTWYQMNKNLFSALKMEKVGMFILVVIVTLVSAFGIISTLIMLVWEKVKEIAVLKSMGATGDGVMKIFIVEGVIIGMVGTLLGLMLGWLVCTLLMNIGLQLNPEVYYIEGLPVNMDLIEFILIAGIAFHISFIATIYPSRRASRLRPAEGLRYD